MLIFFNRILYGELVMNTDENLIKSKVQKT